ncbi:hypothetical protein NKH77_24610 [Streptomyces sp. M19]
MKRTRTRPRARVRSRSRGLRPAEAPTARTLAGTFTNPIVSQNGADPTVIRYAGYYYHLGTTWASRCCDFWAPNRTATSWRARATTPRARTPTRARSTRTATTAG